MYYGKQCRASSKKITLIVTANKHMTRMYPQEMKSEILNYEIELYLTVVITTAKVCNWLCNWPNLNEGI